MTKKFDENHFLVSDIPNLLRRLRARHKLSLRGLSTITGNTISAATLSRVETGKSDVSIEDFHDIAAALGYTLVFSLEREGKPFEMFGAIELELLYALERKQWAKAIHLMSILVGEEGYEVES